MALENPKYTTLQKDGKFEIRKYEGYIMAEVEIEADHDSALRGGFTILADYIFGNNKKRTHIAMTAPVMEQENSRSEKISMTTPVSAKRSKENAYIISFVMPSKYSLDNLPEPKSEAIHFREVKAHKVAAIRFSGYLNGKLARRKIEELNEWMQKNDINPRDNFVSAQYNPPWIPGFLRRNEIMVSI